MPVYKYRCGKCGAALEVIRDLYEWDIPPTTEEWEMGQQGAVSDCSHADSKRELGRFMLTRGETWGGSKGNW